VRGLLAHPARAAAVGIAIHLSGCCARLPTSARSAVYFNWYLVGDDRTCGSSAATPCLFLSLINYGERTVAFDDLVVFGVSLDASDAERVSSLPEQRTLEPGRVWTYRLDDRFRCRLPLRVELRTKGRATIVPTGPEHRPIEMSREGIDQCSRSDGNAPHAALH